jgi:hypothetical protein
MDSDVPHTHGGRESDGGWPFLLIGSVQPLLPTPTRTTQPHSSGYLTSLSRTKGKREKTFEGFFKFRFEMFFLGKFLKLTNVLILI